MEKRRCSWIGFKLLLTLMLLMLSAVAEAATVSGTVTNNTGSAGRVFLTLSWSGGGDAGLGKSVTVAANSSASYSIRGVQGGDFVVNAFLDTQNAGMHYANDPLGVSAPFNVTGADVPNVNVTLNNPSAVALQPPVGAQVVAGDGGVLVMWDPAKDLNSRQIATSYKVYWSTTSNPGPLNMTGGGSSIDSANLGDVDAYLKAFANGTQLYFSVTSKLGGTESAPVNANGGLPVTIGPATGGVAVSGTVTTTGATLGAGTPLYLAVASSSGPPQYVGLVAAPSSSQAFSIAGVQPGSYGVYAILDMDNNGFVNLGDINNTDGDGAPVTVSSAPVTGVNVSLAGGPATVAVMTEHSKNSTSEWYSLNLRASMNGKRPVNAAASGPNLSQGTVDMGLSNWGPLEARPGLIARPTLTPADTYSFAIEYSDNTSTGASPLTAQVTAVLDSFATATSPVGYVPFPFNGSFNWSAPASPPTPYSYSFWLSVPGFSDDGFFNMPPSTTNATYTTFTNYVDGNNYDWSITVKDIHGNRALRQTNFTPTTSPVVTGFTPAIGGPGTAVTITGFNFDATAANNVVTFPGSFTATPSSASATQLVVAVPSNVATSSGPISVAVGAKSGQSSSSFTIDATPPVTTASPLGGTQTGPINVTLTANEPATIYYTTNGTDPTYPVSGQTQTYSATIPISTTTTVLKYFARDSYGNKEAIQNQVYFYGTPTTLALAVDNAAITYGQAITATATVSPGAATGTVTFFVDSVQYGLPVAVSAGPANMVISGLAVTGSPHTIQALYGGDATYAGSGNTTTVTVAKAASTVAVNVGSYTYNASPQGPSSATITGSSGAVTWSYAGVSGTTYGPSATLPTNAGSYTATATVAADANYNSASSSATAFTIAMANQTITVTSAAQASAAYNSTFTVAATAPGGTVTYSSGSPAVCTNVGATFTMVASAGACIVNYDQAGNTNYNAAPQVTSSNTTATKGNQTITFAALPTKNTVDAPFSLTATASSGLAVSYTSSNTSVATVSGSTVTIVAAGTTNITASQAGDANWNAATPVTQSQLITTGQTITVTTPAPATAPFNGSFTVAATSNSGLTVAYSSGSPSICVNSGATFTMMSGTGTCIVQYDQAGDATYLAAPQVTSSVTATKVSQGAVTVTTPASASYGQTGLVATATGGSGTGALAYDAGSSTACSVNATTGALTITSGTGTCAITATRQGDSNYNASAASAAGSVTISKATATVALSGLTKTYNGSAQAAAATTTPAALTVNITYDGSATVPVNAGTYAVVATISDTNYQGSASGSLVIAKANANVAISNLTQTADGTPKGVTITTTPASLAVSVTYNGLAAIPSTTGTYNVAAAITDPNYQGSATATLNVVAYGDISGSANGQFDGTVSIVDAVKYLRISLKLDPPPAYTGNLLLAPIVAGKPTAIPGSRAVNILDVRAMLEKVAGLW